MYWLFLSRNSLQRFKIDVASTVVNQQNAGLGTMETDQLLDLFNISSSSSGDVVPMPSESGDVEQITHANAVDAMGVVKDKGKKSFLDEIGELWDEKQYDEEFDLTSFLETMKGWVSIGLRENSEIKRRDIYFIVAIRKRELDKKHTEVMVKLHF